MNIDQEKRVMLAFVLSLVMLLLYRVYFVKEPPPEAEKPVPTAKAPTAKAEGAKPTSAMPSTAASAPAALPVVQGTKAEELVVESNLYRVTFSTVGADVRSWVLKNYPKGEQIDVIDSHACDALGYPLTLNLESSALTSEVNQANYVAKVYRGGATHTGQKPEELSGNTFAPPVDLSFTYSNGKIRVEKHFSFGNPDSAEDKYSVKTEVSVSDGEHELPVGVAWPGGFGDQSVPPAMEARYEKAVYETLEETKIRQVTLSPSFLGHFFSGGGEANANTSRQDVPGPLLFAGLEDQFFAGVFLPNSPEASALITRDVWTPPDFHGEEKDKPRPLGIRIGSVSSKPLDFRILVAPKDLAVLQAYNPPLGALVDFGFFSIVAKPLFICMRYINDHWIHNYGWSIVLITIIISIALFPMRLKALRSAQEMQKVQPILKGIQDKYKQYKVSDPRRQKMQEEMMEVYKKYGISPFGSCLPMLVQGVAIYPFYEVLEVAIELRHAPWILWVKDLSAPDCWMVSGHCVPVLVIIMTIVSLVLQRMTPMASVDPSQKRMMVLMPLVFAFMFLKLASGMVLYWLTSSAVQVVQQIFINRLIPSPATGPVARKPVESKG